MNDLTDRQLATIIAALELYKNKPLSERAKDGEFLQCLDSDCADDPDHGEKPLSDEEISELREIASNDLGKA
jgi:hypothetical protein